MVLVPEGVKFVVPDVALAVHEKVVPATLEVNVTAVEVDSEQIVWPIGILVTSGFGLTVIV